MTTDKLAGSLDGLDAKAQKATPGPRHFCNQNSCGGIYPNSYEDHGIFASQHGCDERVAIAASSEWTTGRDEDWEFLAAFDPSVVRALVAVAKDFATIHESQSCPYCEHGLDGTDCQTALAELRRVAEGRQ